MSALYIFYEATLHNCICLIDVAEALDKISLFILPITGYFKVTKRKWQQKKAGKKTSTNKITLVGDDDDVRHHFIVLTIAKFYF